MTAQHIAEKATNRKYVFERPNFLDLIQLRGEKSRAVAKLAQEIKKLKSAECIKYDINQFETIYGKNRDIKWKLSNMRQRLKNEFNIKKPRIVFDEGLIYIWENRI